MRHRLQQAHAGIAVPFEATSSGLDQFYSPRALVTVHLPSVRQDATVNTNGMHLGRLILLIAFAAHGPARKGVMTRQQADSGRMNALSSGGQAELQWQLVLYESDSCMSKAAIRLECARLWRFAVPVLA